MVVNTGDGELPADTAAVTSAPTAGQTMRAGREAAGMSLADVALATRVPQRHLEALERGDYSSLPSITYCTGFARAHARAVGIDPVPLVAQVRQELSISSEGARSSYAYEEAADPARIPPRWLALGALLLVAVLLGAYAIWRTQMNSLPVEAQVEAPAPAVASAPPPPMVQNAVAAGSVVLTAVEDVWMRVYEKDGRRFFDQVLNRGISFTVPADAANPLILTGRPDALTVTVAGRAVAPLGTAERTVADLPISAAALLARPADGSQTTDALGNVGSDGQGTRSSRARGGIAASDSAPLMSPTTPPEGADSADNAAGN